ncbi:uncharacterized protein LOC125068733 [Vanessa atalanta]|uniref:uncharacterized protein LOC125068733 n=1 Tax=Vanessa atalanta TaxID=42275 RepID=UPI001FCE2A6E|nr:uncharacterized protein LOC125068733 [Vanessa atalanta]
MKMAFELPRLKKCCCCLPLRAGSLVIGYLSTVFSLFCLGILSFSLYKVVTFVQTHQKDPDPEHTPEEYEQVSKSLYITHAYMIIVYIYYLIISLFLITGIHMNKTLFMRYYYNCGLFLLMLALATVVVSTVFLHFIATILLLKWCVIIFYCLLVVRSSYLEIEEKNNPRNFEMQNLYIPHRAPLLL